MRRAITLCCLAAAVTVIGCQAPVETKPVTTKLGSVEPVSLPPPGSKWLGLQDGKEAEITLVEVNGDELSFKSSWGCSWTRNEYMFSPSTKFSNCGGNTGNQNITGSEGKIWPLEIGKSQSWSLSGNNERGDTWETTRRCEVVSAERVSVVAGEFDTYKVVCNDSWRTRTWYYAPSINNTVLFTNLHRRRNTTEKWELVQWPSNQ